MEATDSWPALKYWFRPWSVKLTGQLFFIYQYRKPNQKIWRKKIQTHPPAPKKKTNRNQPNEKTNKQKPKPPKPKQYKAPPTNKQTPQQQTSKEKPYNT